jgi:hypothetical protein
MKGNEPKKREKKRIGWKIRELYVLEQWMAKQNKELVRMD